MVPFDRQVVRGGPRDRLAGLATRERALMQATQHAIGSNQLAEANQTLQRVQAIAPAHPEVLRLAALLRYRDGAPHEAIELLRLALASWPDDAILLSVTGGILGNLGAYGEALAMLREACRLDPGAAAAWFNLARVQNTLGDIADANETLVHALAADPGHLNARTLRANVLAILGDVAAAADEYRHAISLAPDFAEAWIGLADLKTVRLTETETTALARLYAA